MPFIFFGIPETKGKSDNLVKLVLVNKKTILIIAHLCSRLIGMVK
jgi:hypothetical protein